MTQRRRYPEGRAILLERPYQVVVAVQRLIGPHDIGHILGQLAHHLGFFGHNVAPHGHTRIALPLDHPIAAVDEIHIDLVGAQAVHQFLGATCAELLRLVTVDDTCQTIIVK